VEKRLEQLLWDDFQLLIFLFLFLTQQQQTLLPSTTYFSCKKYLGQI